MPMSVAQGVLVRIRAWRGEVDGTVIPDAELALVANAGSIRDDAAEAAGTPEMAEGGGDENSLLRHSPGVRRGECGDSVMKATLIIIENDRDHAQAKTLIEELMGSDDVADQARIATQARLIEAYERSRRPQRRPTLPDLPTYLVEQHGLWRADLVPLLGTASRVSEVMNGKRELSMSMVRKLRERFQISADLLISVKRPRGLAA
jgi:HTH-type transcriptional regulator/antitoxin HigA